jgi:hypothetical protein
MQIDAIARIHFYDVQRGGIAFTPETASGSHFGSIAEIDGECYSCWIVNSFNQIAPGQTLHCPITFMYPELVRPKLRPGLTFFLKRDARTNAAEAQILEIVAENPTIQ